MISKKVLFSLAAVAMASFVACGDDSSSGSTASEAAPASIEKFEEIEDVACSRTANLCAKVYLVEHNDTLQCNGSQWNTMLNDKPVAGCEAAPAAKDSSGSTASESAPASVQSLEELADVVCSQTANLCAKVYLVEYKDTLQCNGSQWNTMLNSMPVAGCEATPAANDSSAEDSAAKDPANSNAGEDPAEPDAGEDMTALFNSMIEQGAPIDSFKTFFTGDCVENVYTLEEWIDAVSNSATDELVNYCVPQGVKDDSLQYALRTIVAGLGYPADSLAAQKDPFEQNAGEEPAGPDAGDRVTCYNPSGFVCVEGPASLGGCMEDDGETMVDQCPAGGEICDIGENDLIVYLYEGYGSTCAELKDFMSK